MGISVRTMNAYVKLTVRINVEIIVSNPPCQDIAGDSGGSPAGSTGLSLKSGGLEDYGRGKTEKERGKTVEAGKE